MPTTAEIINSWGPFDYGDDVNSEHDSSSDESLSEDEVQEGVQYGSLGKRRAGDFEDDPFSSIRKGLRLASDEHPGWEAMPAGCTYKEVQIYSKIPSNETTVQHISEVAEVLLAAFPMCLEPNTGECLANIVDRIDESSNYEVSRVLRVQNTQRVGMHDAFKSFYDIKNTRTVYHGTTNIYGASISKAGFRGACSQRSKFGKGIYTSSNVWEALTYSEPTPDMTQTFLVVKLLQGPTTLGRFEMVDFGEDAEGHQILTATNPENTIFCASHGDQLLAEYRIEMRFLADRQHNPAHQNLIGRYHPDIWKLIKKQTALLLPVFPKYQIASPMNANTVAPPTSSSSFIKDLSEYKGVSVGDKVKIVKTFKTHSFCNEHEGIVRKIFNDGRVHYCVEVCDASLVDQIKTANGVKYTYADKDINLLRCNRSHFVCLRTNTASSRLLVAGTAAGGSAV